MSVTRSTVLYQDMEIANPGANTGLINAQVGAGLTPKGRAPTLRVSVTPSTTSIISVTETDGTNITKHVLNDGVACTAGADENNARTYQVDLVAVPNNVYDVEFQTAQTGNTAKIYRVVVQRLEL